MSKITRTALAAALLLSPLFSPAALAANRFPVLQVAFNRTGSQVMVLSGGEADGSGFAVAALEVRNTANGTLTRRFRGQRQTGTGADLAGRLLAQSQPQLRALGFAPGLSVRPVYRRTFGPFVSWAEGTPTGKASVTPVKLWTRAVPVRLSVTAAPGHCRYAGLLPEGERPASFALTVNGQRVAAGRGDDCTSRYALESVYVQGNRAAFLLRAYTVGFEGPDAKLQVVAATLR